MNGSDPIADLLRLTGPRPAIPAERAARVRAAVHDHWRAGLAGRARRRALARRIAALAALLLVAVAVPIARGWRPFRGGGAKDVVARVEIGGSSWPPGRTLASGAMLETSGADRLAVRLPSGHSVRLDTGSRARLVSAGLVELLGGGLYVDSGGTQVRADAVAGLRIRTPAGTVQERGTQFEVRLIDAAVRVRVREGHVALNRPDGPLEVAAGREVFASADGGVRESPLDSAVAWDWVGEIAPLPAIEGRTLGEFLDWYARERGRAIGFADPALETSARAIRLSGSIEGMTPDQALDSVLTISRLGRRPDADIVFIEPASGPQ